MSLSLNIKKRVDLRPILLLTTLLLIPLYAEPMRNGILNGIQLCVKTIIPCVFPFMILSSMLLHSSAFDLSPGLSRLFEKAFHINKNGLCAFLCGCLCGFPLGAKCAKETYVSGRISEDECERLIGFSSNASPAFLISGVGVLRKSIAEGVFLYIVMVLSAILVGLLIGRKKEPSSVSGTKKTLDFSFTDTVEGAGIGTLYVCSYLLFFSALIGILKAFVFKSALINALFLPLLEIGAASTFLSNAELPEFLALALTGFAASFGGFSVHLQSAGILRDTKISMKYYYFSKFLQGILSFSIILFLCALRALFMLNP